MYAPSRLPPFEPVGRIDFDGYKIAAENLSGFWEGRGDEAFLDLAKIMASIELNTLLDLVDRFEPKMSSDLLFDMKERVAKLKKEAGL